MEAIEIWCQRFNHLRTIRRGVVWYLQPMVLAVVSGVLMINGVGTIRRIQAPRMLICYYIFQFPSVMFSQWKHLNYKYWLFRSAFGHSDDVNRQRNLYAQYHDHHRYYHNDVNFNPPITKWLLCAERWIPANLWAVVCYHLSILSGAWWVMELASGI